MNYLLSYLTSFVRHDSGQDLLEYALLVALIALVTIGAVTAAGVSINTIFTDVSTGIAAPAAP